MNNQNLSVRFASRKRLCLTAMMVVAASTPSVHAQLSTPIINHSNAVEVSIRHWSEEELAKKFSNTTSVAVSSELYARNGRWGAIESHIDVFAPISGPLTVNVSVLINSEKRGLELLEGTVNRSYPLVVGEPWPVWLFIPPDKYQRWGNVIVVGTKVEVSGAEKVVAEYVSWQGGKQPWPRAVPRSTVALVPLLASPWALTEETPSGELVNRVRPDADQVLLRQFDAATEQAIIMYQVGGEGTR